MWSAHEAEPCKISFKACPLNGIHVKFSFFAAFCGSVVVFARTKLHKSCFYGACGFVHVGNNL